MNYEALAFLDGALNGLFTRDEKNCIILQKFVVVFQMLTLLNFAQSFTFDTNVYVVG